jgi:tetratricopeptide (TPR) repeat protein
MKQLALHEMGEIIRKVRKERGLRLEDLADENISPATVSNIERGVAHVSPEKITYLLDKLNLPQHRLPEMMVKEQNDLEKIKFQFLIISTLEAMDEIDEALQQLENLEIDDNHPYIAQAYYYKGQCYLRKNKWKQAERAFYNALRSSQQSNYKDSNMESASYLMLGYTHYKLNRLEEALDYTDHGLRSFEEKGENQFIKFHLVRNKALILRKTNRITEGIRIIEEIWPTLSHATDLETTLSFYILRAEFLYLSGLTKEAIRYATSGIRIAKRNQHFQSLIELWTILGIVHLEENNYESAETSLQIALKIEPKLTDDDPYLSPYYQLGRLYLKQNKPQEAYQYLHSGLSLAEKSHHYEETVQLLYLLGQSCVKTEKFDEAVGFYQRGIELLPQTDHPEWEARFWYGLAQCWDGRDEEKFAQCLHKLYQLRQPKQDVFY